MKQLLALALLTALIGCEKTEFEKPPQSTNPGSGQWWINATVYSLYLESAKTITDTGKNYISTVLLQDNTYPTNPRETDIKGYFEHITDSTLVNNTTLVYKGRKIEAVQIFDNESGILSFTTDLIQNTDLLYALAGNRNYGYKVGKELRIHFKYGKANDRLPDTLVINRMNQLLQDIGNRLYFKFNPY